MIKKVFFLSLFLLLNGLLFAQEPNEIPYKAEQT